MKKATSFLFVIFFFFFFLAGVHARLPVPALPRLRPEAVPPPAGPERGLHGRDQLLQPHPHDRTLPAGTERGGGRVG